MAARNLTSRDRELLLELAATATGGGALPGRFARCAALLAEAVRLDALALFVAEDDGGWVRVAGAWPEEREPAIVGRVLAPGELGLDPVVSAAGASIEPGNDGQVAAGALARMGYRAGWAIPLFDQGEPVGLVVAGQREARPLGEREEALLREAANLLGAAAGREREARRAVAAAAQSRALNVLATHLSLGTPLDEMFADLRRALPDALAYDWVALAVVDLDGSALRVVGAEPEGPLGAGQAFARAAAGGAAVPFGPDGIHEYEPGQALTPFGRAVAEAGYRRGLVARLLDGDELAGTFNLARRADRPLSVEDRAFIATLARLLALAVGTRRRQLEASLAAERSGILNELALLLSRGDGPEAFYAALSTRLQSVLDFDGFSLWVAAGPDHLRVVDSLRRRSTGPGYTATRASFGNLLETAAGSTVIEAPIEEFSGPVASSNRAAGVKRAAAIALRHEGQDEGLILMSRMSERPLGAEEVAHLETVAAMVGQALANHRKVRERMGEALRRQALSELTLLLQGGQPIREHFEALLRIVRQGLGFDLLSITFRDPATGQYLPLRSPPLDIDADPDFQESGVDAAADAGGVIQYRTERNERQVPQALSRAGFRRAATAVMTSSEGNEGLVTIGRIENERFDEPEMEFIRLVAALFGQAVANHRARLERERRAQQEHILSEVALFVNDGAPIEAHFERLSRLLVGARVADFVAIAAREPLGDRYRLLRSIDPEGLAPVFVDDTRVRRLLETKRRSLQLTREEAASEPGLPPEVFEGGITRIACVLLEAGGEPEGVFTVGRRANVPFDEEDLRFAELAGALAAYAIANRRRVEQSAAEAEEQRIIAQAAAAVARERQPEAIAAGLAEAIGSFVADPVVRIAFLRGEELEVVREGGERLVVPIGTRVAEAVTTGVPVTLGPDAPVVFEASKRALEGKGIVTRIVAPARAGGETVGLLLVLSRDAEFQVGERELRLVRLIADIVGPALANLRAVEQQRREAEEQRIIAAAAAAVAREVDTLGILRGLRSAVREFIPKPFAGFGFLEGDHLRFPTGEKGSDVVLPIGPGFAEALAGRPVVITNARGNTPEAAEAIAQVSLQSHVLAPAYSRGAVVGLLVLGSHDEGFEPGAREARLTGLIADIVGPAMASALSVERERREAEDQAVVASAAAAVAREHDALAITQALAAVVRRFVPAPYVAFGFIDGNVVQFPNRAGPPTIVPVGANFRLAIDEGHTIVPPVAERVSPGGALPELESLGIQAHIVAAASSGGAPVGLLIMGSRDAEFAPGEREVRLARLIADIVGPAMANARAAERERLDAEDQRLLTEIAALAAREATPDAMVVALQRPLRRLVPLPIVSFGLKEGELVHFPMGDGTVFETALDAYFRIAEEDGQSASSRLPDDVDPASPLWSMGVRATSVTAARAGGRTIGFLLVASRHEEYDFGERELRLQRLIAQIVGPAMENARTAERTREDAAEQRFLADIAAVATRAATEPELVVELGSQFRWLVPAARLDLLVFDEAGNLVSSVNEGVKLPVGFDYPDAHAPEPVVRVPAEAITEASRERQRQMGIVRSVNARLAPGGASMGVLWVGTSDPQFRFGARHLRVIKLAADILGPAMANLRERRRRIEEAEEQRFLADAASAAARATNDAEFLQGLTVPFGRLIPGAAVGFRYVEGERLVDSVTGEAWPLGPGVRRAIEARQSVDTLEKADMLPENRERLAAAGLGQWVTTTASSEGETIGVLVLGTRDSEYTFSDRDLRLCRLVADIAGPAMANFRERRRRMEEAEDERIIANVAATAAAARTVAEVVNHLPTTLGGRVPGAFAMYGFVRGEAIAYQMTTPGGRAATGQDELVVEFSPVAREALASGQGVGDLAQDGNPFGEEFGLCAYALTAYHAAGGVSGMLMVASRDPAFRFGPRELALLRRITAVVGPVIETVYAQAERERQAEEQRILAEVSAAAATAPGPTDILRAMTPVLESFVPAAFAAFGRFDGNELAWPHLLGGELRLSILPHEEEARRSGQVVVPGEAVPADHFGPTFGFRVVSYTATYSAGVPSGLLLVASRQEGHEFSERDLLIIRRISQVVGPAIEAAMATQDRVRQAAIYGLILRSLSEAVILLDRTGRPLFVNSLGQEIVQAVDPDNSAEDFHEIVPRLPQELREPFRRAFEDGVGSQGRATMPGGGEPRYFDYEFVPLSDPQMRLLIVAADVTEEVRREREEEATRARMDQASRLAALGELIGGVAHELNNPLTAILGFAEVLALSDTAGQMNEEIAIIQKEALRARNIVRDLLFIARPGAVEHGPVAIADVVGHVQRLRERLWRRAGIHVEVSLEPGLVVRGDEHQLTQVLLNLVTNAEHALEGRSLRRIVIEGGTDEVGQVRLAVSDTGAGMDEATRSRIYEPFFTTKHGVGTGLGLPLSYSIIRSHQGTIDCISSPGLGTTFVITLPARGDAPGATGGQGVPAPARPATLLVIDDESSLRKVCRRLVESLGHRCADAENSARALALAEELNPDIILCDYRLATETADAVFAGFAERLPHLIPRTIIATGATTDAGVAALIERYGVELLAKPYGMEDIARVIRERMGDDAAEAPGA
jgi:signal transduction histidine kinase/ActR/RegA family two-component response regulator